ncbi:MAG: hypothetical protein AB2989_05570 [Candidatus Symbiodolus clandestinus]
MAKITIYLPRTIVKENELFLDVSDIQQLFYRIKQINDGVFNILFREVESKIIPKGFLAIFINNEQVFDISHIFKDGDKIVFSMAIAGG